MSDNETDGQFEQLVEYLQRARGFEFGGYKRPGLMRRIEKRMGMVGVADFPSYVDYLQVHPDEFASLFDAILINVTSFFRDPPVWEFLRTNVVPRLLELKPADHPVRAWSAGCASGEEAYTLAILFAEALGQANACERVKIYATDVDEHALGQARQAVYGARELETLPPGMLEKYFTPAGEGRHQFSKELRRCVIFGRHDLLSDAPISRVDLLVCRNALMYFNAEAQTKILSRFHFALNNEGFLVLGKAETLLTRAHLFMPLDLPARVFEKVSRLNVRDRLLVMAQGTGQDGDGDGAAAAAQGGAAHTDRLRDASFDSAPVAQIVVDAGGTLALANRQARDQLKLTARDVGRPIQDLELSYRPVELRSLIERVYNERRTVTLRGVEWAPRGGEAEFFDLEIVPLFDPPGTAVGVTVSFIDVTRPRRLQAELQRVSEAQEAAYEELQSTGEELQTTNEELQSTVEELETTNEELQSTNEELETMNEEIQSTNEELQTLNDELHQRTDELGEVNALLGSILSSLRAGVAVVDRELRVIAWNPRAEDLWGIREAEVQGRSIVNLDIGLPVDKLIQPLRGCMSEDAGTSETVVPAVNRRGRRIDCKVTCTPLRGPGRENRGVIMLMEEQSDGQAR